MSRTWLVFALILAVTTTLLNTAIFVAQLSTPAEARTAGTSATKLLDDDDFVDRLTKLVRKTVRDYCTVGKRDGIDC